MKAHRVLSLMLSLSLVFGVFTPVFASTNAAVRLVEIHGIILPVGDELSDEELAEVDGQWVPIVAGGIIAGATYAVAARDQEKDAGWYARLGAAVAVGAVTGGTGAALAGVTTTKAGLLAATLYTGAKEVVVGAGLAEAGR